MCGVVLVVFLVPCFSRVSSHYDFTAVFILYFGKAVDEILCGVGWVVYQVGCGFSQIADCFFH